MPEIKIPDELAPDCSNCQGLCCVAMSHKRKDGFPIKEDKPVDVPCHNLETDPTNLRDLYKCRIHDTLGQKGWVTCTYFDCHGAGQAISIFFKELGFSWALESPDMDKEKRALMLKNLNTGYFILLMVFSYLKMIQEEFGFARETRLNAARAAAAEVAKEFSIALQSDTEIDITHWYKEKFHPAMKTAADRAGTSYMRRKFGFFWLKSE